MKTQPKFVQVAVPRWVASLPENAKLLVGHQCIGPGGSAKTRSALNTGNSEAIRVTSPVGRNAGDAECCSHFDTLTVQSANGSDPGLSSVEVKSTPDGADNTVDEKYMGSTPSTLKLTAGDHKIKLEKSGFKAWEHTLTLGAGATPTINATLDKE